MTAPTRRARGEGWEVWLDGQGLLWAKVTMPQHGIAAAACAEALREVLEAEPVRALVVDRRAAGPDTEAARDALLRLLALHPRLPVAVVARDPEGVRGAFALRGSREGDVRAFGSLQAARSWLARRR